MDNRKDQVESWYRNYNKNIVKWTKARSLQDAEDILQNLAISLLTNPAEWEIISRKKAHKFANHDYYNRKRKDKAHYQSSFKSLEDIMNKASSSNLTEELITRKSLELVEKLAGELQGRSREIFAMHFFEEMDYVDISKKLNITQASCREIGSQAKKVVVMKFNEIIEGEKPTPKVESIVPGYDPNIKLEDIEKNYIQLALQFYKNNITQTAKALGITHKTLYNKINKWNSKT